MSSFSVSLNQLEVNLLRHQINDGDADQIVADLQRNTTIRTLQINIYGIAIGKIVQLTETLATHPTLTSLNLRGSRIRHEEILHLARALGTNMTLISLNLNGNHIGSPGAQAIATALTTNSTLLTLELGRNSIDYSGVTHLFTALTVNTTLRSLNLSGNLWAGIRPIRSGEDVIDLLSKNFAISTIKLPLIISDRVKKRIEKIVKRNTKNQHLQTVTLFQMLWSVVLDLLLPQAEACGNERRLKSTL